MPVIMKMTPAGRRAEYLSYEDAEIMVENGTAVKNTVYHGIYEEVTDAERSQGYSTRNMQALPVVKRRGRSPKVNQDEPAASEE